MTLRPTARSHNSSTKPPISGSIASALGVPRRGHAHCLAVCRSVDGLRTRGIWPATLLGRDRDGPHTGFEDSHQRTLTGTLQPRPTHARSTQLHLGGLLRSNSLQQLCYRGGSLHRRLGVNTIFPTGGPTRDHHLQRSANTWEFSLMLKWSRLPLIEGRIRPFLEENPHLAGRYSCPAVPICDCRGGRRHPLWQKVPGAHHPVHAMGEGRGFSALCHQGRSGWLLTSVAWGTSVRSDPRDRAQAETRGFAGIIRAR